MRYLNAITSLIVSTVVVLGICPSVMATMMTDNMYSDMLSVASTQTAASTDISSATVTTSITDTASITDLLATITVYRTVTMTDIRIQLASTGGSSDYAALRIGIVAASIIAGFLLLAVILLAWLLLWLRRAENPFLDPAPMPSSASIDFGDVLESISQGKYVPDASVALTRVRARYAT
ncbi:hypothetical protein C8Q73DRAFT_371573 [Cubamyces lactineus]|nr:hypothetical protein C8Q73DRAFT_371573 [Cubamyces lactineus]